MMAALNINNLRGTLLLNESMQKHTSWRAGGSASQFYVPADVEDLAKFIAGLPTDENILFIGLGSNLLVRDGGYKGTVISLKGSLSNIEMLTANRVRVGAGTSCAKLARFCHRNNLIGGEFFAGIPGLTGGALAMNAGAFGGETWPLVESVITLDRQGVTHTRSSKDYEISYRTVKGHEDEWFISADLKLQSGNGEEAAKRVKALLDKRNKTQPTGLPSCGSVFKNPEADFAARLIEESGLKAYSIGGATVSEKHANFIINSASATAEDIEKLICHVQKTVKQKYGVELKTEVKIVGEHSDESL